MNISIIGTGNIGSTLGRKWAKAGHTIKFGVHNAADPKHQPLLDAGDGKVTVAPVAEAVSFGDVVLLAIPGSAVDALVTEFGDALTGKIIIDATNQIGQAEMNSLGPISARVPTARLFRAFNSLGWENFDNPQLGGSQIDLFFCGDAGDARQTVERLIADVGLRPIYVGDLGQVEVVDNLTKLWFALAIGQGYGHRVAFKLLRK
jgi:predicted dinucleotide-binding enzyme